MSHSGSGSALASLTATYTDSEGEEENEENRSPEEGSGSGQSPVVSNGVMSEGSDHASDRTTSRQPSPAVFSSITITTKMTTLVSYHDDTIVSDEGEGDEENISNRVILISDNDKQQEDVEMPDEDDVIIPPEPPGSCSVELQDKILKLYKKMDAQNMDMNAAIQKRKDFRNPSIYEKLVQFCGVNELGTNYPPSIYDPLKWNKESYYEELAKVQKTEMDKREKERKGKAEATTKKLEEEALNKRKSKWDMPAVGKPGNVTTVAPPTLTTTVTGTKATVISAFGSLPKKSKP